MADDENSDVSFANRAVGVFGYSRRALDLVWTTSRTLTFTLAALTLVAGVLPAAIAYVGQLIVDGVVTAMSSASPETRRVLWRSAGRFHNVNFLFIPSTTVRSPAPDIV